MKAINIKWDIDMEMIQETLEAMAEEDAAKTLHVPLKEYTKMTQEEREALIERKFEGNLAAATDLMGLPHEIEVPDGMEDDDIRYFLSDQTGYCHRGYELDSDDQREVDEEMKVLPFHWSFGTEDVSIVVGEYENTGRIYVGLINYEDGVPEMFADITVNIPEHPLPSKAMGFIANDFTDEIIAFIEENQLGTMLGFSAHSGYVDFPTVQFNLDRLAEFAPEDIEEFKDRHPEL